MRGSRPTAVSLYTGVGGLDYGFEAAGFRTAVAVEIDPDACTALRANRPHWPVIETDVHALPSAALLKAAGLEPGEADVLIAGPPCQPFSKASFWSGRGNRGLEDPRADTLLACLRILADTRPRTFLIENVQGLVHRRRNEGMRRLLQGIDEINRRHKTRYAGAWQVLDAADYGVPQHRRRVFLVGSRDGRRFRFPEPTHGPADADARGERRKPYVTCWDALGGASATPAEDAETAMTGRWADLLPSIPEGQNYLWHTSRGGGLSLFGWRTRYWNFLLKLAKSRPAWTIPGQLRTAVGPFHWTSRKLTASQMARLQTFPEDVRLNASLRTAQRLAGNAVASLMGEVLAREIRRQLLDGAPEQSQPKLLPRTRRGCPEPEPVLEVPAKYLELVGRHPDHPGTQPRRP